MSNHFHLLSEVDRFSTARILQSLLTGYVRHINKIHHGRGHLFEGRYKAIVCDRDSYLLELVRNIHLNPVRAALVKRPGEWRWSGHREYLGKEKSGLIELKDLLKSVATKAGLSAEILLRKGRLAKVVEARDRFIRQAVLAQGYLASQVANFLACHPSNVSRALQKS